MMPALKLVGAETRAAPYDTDVGAKGWRFELDYERIEQSDTWALADPEVRPWLLMLWMTAWKQRPCGSFPNDDVLIAARIGMKLNAFKANRDVLLRGWSLAEDGRIYHDTIVEQVTKMLDKKTSERERKQRFREAQLAAEAERNVPRDIGGTPLEGRGVPPIETLPEPTTGTITTTTTPAAAVSKPRGAASRSDFAPQCPHEEIVATFHRILPALPAVRHWHKKRREKLQAVWSADAKYQTLAFWEIYFGFVGRSAFLRGDVPPSRDSRRPWQATLEWLVTFDNFVKVIEGSYQDAESAAQPTDAGATQ